LGMLPGGGPPSGLEAGVPSGFAGAPKGFCLGWPSGLPPNGFNGGAPNPGGEPGDEAPKPGGGAGGCVEAAGMVTTVLHLGQRAERPAELSGVRILALQEGHWNSMGMAYHNSSCHRGIWPGHSNKCRSWRVLS
jgi:hypothetical protein